MTIKPIITQTSPTLRELTKQLGKIAILEGENHLVCRSNAETVNELLNPSLVILNLYKDFSLFPDMAKLDIETIIIESTFTYEDKIKKVMYGLLTLYKQTGWKPKRIINTMSYGLDKLFMLCQPLNIEVHQLNMRHF